MSLPMVKIEGVPDAADAKPGMAFFADTGPFGRTCGECVHRGYTRQSGNGRWDEARQEMIYRHYRVTSCAMFLKMAGHHGPPVETDYHACKYFEAKK